VFFTKTLRKDHLQLVIPNGMRETELEESHAGREKIEFLAVIGIISSQAMQSRSNNVAELEGPPVVLCRVLELGIHFRWWQLTSWDHYHQANMINATY